jgi:hypothetical protein
VHNLNLHTKKTIFIFYSNGQQLLQEVLFLDHTIVIVKLVHLIELVDITTLNNFSNQKGEETDEQ